eukprot:256815_1
MTVMPSFRLHGLKFTLSSIVFISIASSIVFFTILSLKARSSTTHIYQLPTANNSIGKTPYFSRVIDNKYAVFCADKAAWAGTGNQLELYWVARAIAYFSNWIFVLNEASNTNTKGVDLSCDSKIQIMFDKKHHPSMKWTWFLPVEYNETFNTHYNSSIKDIYNQSLQPKEQRWYRSPFCNVLALAAFNPSFIPVVQNNTRDAFERYYAYGENTSSVAISSYNYSVDPYKGIFYESWVKELENKDTNIIAIHIRMGDVLVVGYRYMFNMQYFVTALDLIFNHNDDFRYKHCKIKFIAQLSDANVHCERDMMALNMSRKIVYFMIEQIEKYIASRYGDYSISYDIIGNDTMDNDYYKLITARYVICSSSTFCFNTAMANYYDPQLIIMPSDAMWRRTIPLFKRMTTKFRLLKHYRWMDTTGMAKLSSQFFTAFHGSIENSTAITLFTLPQNGFIRFKQWFIKIN